MRGFVNVTFSPEFQGGNLDFKKVKPSLATIVAGGGIFVSVVL